MKIEKNAHLCHRCSQVCFDPIDVQLEDALIGPGGLRRIRLCYECLEAAVRRSGGRGEHTISEVRVMWREP